MYVVYVLVPLLLVVYNNAFFVLERISILFRFILISLFVYYYRFILHSFRLLISVKKDECFDAKGPPPPTRRRIIILLRRVLLLLLLATTHLFRVVVEKSRQHQPRDDERRR